MEVRLATHRVTLPPRAAAALERRIRHRLRRLATRVARLRITLADVNGPRGGRDKVCTLEAEFVDGGRLLVRERSEELWRALGRCLRRGRRSIDRALSRRDLARRRVRLALPSVL